MATVGETFPELKEIQNHSIETEEMMTRKVTERIEETACISGPNMKLSRDVSRLRERA